MFLKLTIFFSFLISLNLFSQNLIDSIVVHNDYSLNYKLHQWHSIQDTVSFPKDIKPNILTTELELSFPLFIISNLKIKKCKKTFDVYLLCVLYIDSNSYVFAFDRKRKVIYYRGNYYKSNRKLYKYFLML